MKQEDLIDFAALVKAYPHTGPFLMAVVFRRLARLGREARSYAERLCNYGERSEGEYDRKIGSITRRTYAALATIGGIQGIEIETGGDPRGSCLKITIPRDNNGALLLRF